MTDDPLNRALAAAMAADRDGDPRRAARHYDAAWALGGPTELAARRRFVIGYGAALRAVGRADEAVGVLGDAVASDPGYPALAAFLALALLDAGHARAALATMLGVVLDGDRAGLDGYDRALDEAQLQLLSAAVPPPT